MALHLVTGGAGFIGSHIVHALVARGDRVRVLDDLSGGRRENLDGLAVGGPGSGAAVELLVASVTDPAACSAAAGGVRGIFHGAAQVSVPGSLEDPVGSYAVNVTGTLQVLEAARRAGAERVVFAASSAAYGDGEELPKTEDMTAQPCSPYASGKIAGEHLMATWARCHGLSTVALRYFNVFGPRQADDSPYSGVIALFARAFLRGRTPTIFGDGEQTRDFVYVEDVVRANLAALEADLPEPHAVINVGTGGRVSLNELARAMTSILGVSIEPEHGPERAGDVRHSQASIERAERLLGYRPQVDWREGLERTLAWYRDAAAARG